MKTPEKPVAKRRRFRVGFGTIIGLVGAVCVLIYGKLTEPKKTDINAGRIVFEADSQGHMRRVDTQSSSPAMPRPPLWKPEPSFLLKNEAELKLSAVQKRSIQTLDSAWRRDQTELKHSMQQMTTETQKTPGEHGVTITHLQKSMSDYSDLSRIYDTRRKDYWTQALKILTDRQSKVLNDISAIAMKAR